MAVWIQIIGLRKSKSIENEKEKISEILNEIDFEFDLDSQKFRYDLKKNNSDLYPTKGNEFFEITMFDESSLRIYFENPNFIEFSGSSWLFSLWLNFVDKKQSRLTNRIRKVFRKIACEYGITEIIYFSEWFFSLDFISNGNATFENLIEQIKNNPDCERNELFGLESEEYYKEKISTVANTVYN
jgi:hypothetical protein